MDTSSELPTDSDHGAPSQDTLEHELDDLPLIELPSFDVEIPPNLLPRSVTRPNAFQLLDGEWRFAIDLDDAGLRDEWQLGHDYPQIAHWPGTVEAHMAEAQELHGQAEGWGDSVVAWYERDFTLPDRGTVPPDSMFQVTLGACGYETRVWLNGHPLKTIEGEEAHFGEYTSFSYELPTKHLRRTNRITVRIADSLDAEIPRGKQQSHVYKRGGIWYQTSTGAVRSIWLETVERNRLRSRVGVVSVVEDRLVRFNLATRIRDAGQYTLRLSVYDRTDAERAHPLATSDYPLQLQRGQRNQRVVLEVPDAELWSTAAPNLYLLVAQLVAETGHASQIEAHFGLRKIESRGRFIYLNNTQVYLDGILYQPGNATFDEMRRHFHAMKRLGCNLIRVHIAGVDPRIYNLADEMGMLLWVEVPSPHSSSQRSRENHWAELERGLALIESHPSVVIWSLYNEDWGAQDIATNQETRDYIVRAYEHMQLNHPQFLVVDNDGWNHISLEGRLKSDLLTAHVYTPSADRWREVLDRLEAGEMDGVAAFPLVVGDPFFYRGQVPLVVSEWGGFGFSDYGGPGEADSKAETIREFKRELRARRVAGDVYTQATGIEDEQNGLLDPHTGELFVPEGILSSRPPEP